MNNDRNNSASGANNGQREQDRELPNREGDPRKRGQQDLRTMGEAEDGLRKDDPSRAPESGTP
ncbi:hypothetical protein ACFFGH_04570 [Lysobacter korlensis]|uniref:Uncharacterized protein n=1 Tax=Lysobacter korlensis TaxID=553636 RepID=A0ABV6RJG6_9GAMM